MLRPTLLLILLTYLLTSVNAATRSRLLNITPEQNLTISNVSSLNADLPVPWGPPNFHIIQSATRLPIPANETFMLVLFLLYHETPQDFNGRLPEARMTYRTPLYPHVEIGVVSTRRDRRVPRKYLLWTIARVLDSFVRGTFTSTNVIMEMNEVKVGTLFFVAHESGAEAWKAERLNSGFQDTVLAPSSFQQSLDRNGTVASFGEDDIEWRFTFHGELLRMEDIFMATIAALIDVARHDDGLFHDRFVGSWPGYRALVMWYAHPPPTRLTKSPLIQSIVCSAYFANREDGNWHELSGVLYVDKQQVASGGCTGTIIPPPGLLGFDSLS